MTTINIGNRPISIQLGVSESTTVPVGETWKVEVIGNGVPSAAGHGEITLNDITLMTNLGLTTGYDSNVIISMVLKAGDVIATSARANCVITGFVIDGN